MQPQNLTIDMVTDNQDNSLTITGHDANNNSYTTGMGRKSDLPSDPTQQMGYYQQILAANIPAAPATLYQAPGYMPPTETNDETQQAPTQTETPTNDQPAAPTA